MYLSFIPLFFSIFLIFFVTIFVQEIGAFSLHSSPSSCAHSTLFTKQQSSTLININSDKNLFTTRKIKIPSSSLKDAIRPTDGTRTEITILNNQRSIHILQRFSGRNCQRYVPSYQMISSLIMKGSISPNNTQNEGDSDGNKSSIIYKVYKHTFARLWNAGIWFLRQLVRFSIFLRFYF